MSKKEIIRKFYESKMGFGWPDHKVLGWESRETQVKRFEVLVSRVELEGKKILDVGCGLGNLLEFLNWKEIRVAYTGVDICEKMIECVKSRNLNGEFYCVDIFNASPFGRKTFDVVFASGIFNLNLGNNREFLARSLERFFELSSRYVVFNLLHVASPNREDKFFYFSPEEVKDMVCQIPVKIKNMEIIEGYLANDFTTVCEIE